MDEVEELLRVWKLVGLNGTGRQFADIYDLLKRSYEESTKVINFLDSEIDDNSVDEGTNEQTNLAAFKALKT